MNFSELLGGLLFIIYLFILVKKYFVFLVFFSPDDGVSPERVAQVMGQPEHCHHAVHLINELVQTAQVPASHFVANAVNARGVAESTPVLNLCLLCVASPPEISPACLVVGARRLWRHHGTPRQRGLQHGRGQRSAGSDIRGAC